MLTNNDEYIEALETVKRELAETRHRVVAGANAELVCMYWRIGGVVDAHASYGSRFIDSLAHDIRQEYPDAKSFNARNLRYMAKFHRETPEEKLHTLYAKLSWSHNKTLMAQEQGARRDWYAHASIEEG